MTKIPQHRVTLILSTLTLAFAAGSMSAQAGSGNGAASSQDRHFLEDTAQDSNFEIKTGRLALQKSSSADVKQYAEMIIHDHTQLNEQIRSTDAAVSITPPAGMSVKDDATYAELKVLSGETFDKAYIKGLIKGNVESVNQAKSEVSSTSVPTIKSLAQRRLALDEKHSARAEKLAQIHDVQAQ